MKILDITEKESGNVEMHVDLTTEETRLLIEKGMCAIIAEMLEEEAKASKTAALLRKPDGSN